MWVNNDPGSTSPPPSSTQSPRRWPTQPRTSDPATKTGATTSTFAHSSPFAELHQCWSSFRYTLKYFYNLLRQQIWWALCFASFAVPIWVIFVYPTRSKFWVWSIIKKRGNQNYQEKSILWPLGRVAKLSFVWLTPRQSCQKKEVVVGDIPGGSEADDMDKQEMSSQPSPGSRAKIRNDTDLNHQGLISESVPASIWPIRLKPGLLKDDNSSIGSNFFQCGFLHCHRM